MKANMVGITCEKCGAHVTVRGLSKCPICKEAIKPIATQVIVDRVPPPVVSSKSTLGGPTIIVVIGVGIAALSLAWAANKIFSPPSQESIRNQAVGAALLQCQQAILRTAQYGDAETPPYVQNHGREDEFYFAWPRGQFEFTNGFGAKVPMSASCIGVLSTGEIKSLTVNGKDIL